MYSYQFSSVWCNSSTVELNGRRANINGVSHTLPPYRSSSIVNGNIFLDGKRWDPSPPKRLKPPQDVQTKTFTSKTVPIELTVKHIGSVTIEHGEEYECTLEVKGEKDALERIVFEHSQSLGSCVFANQDDEFESLKLKIVIPSECGIGRLYLKNIRDPISVVDLHVPGLKLEIRHGNTDVTLHRLRLDSILVGLGNGDVDVENIQAEREVQIDTVSGHILVKDVRSDVLELASVGGLQELTGDCPGKLYAQTVSGSVSLLRFHGKGGKIQTVSGNVLVSQDMEKEIGSMSVKTVSGSLTGNGMVGVKFSSVSGRNSYSRRMT